MKRNQTYFPKWTAFLKERASAMIPSRPCMDGALILTSKSLPFRASPVTRDPIGLQKVGASPGLMKWLVTKVCTTCSSSEMIHWCAACTWGLGLSWAVIVRICWPNFEKKPVTCWAEEGYNGKSLNGRKSARWGRASIVLFTANSSTFSGCVGKSLLFVFGVDPCCAMLLPWGFGILLCTGFNAYTLTIVRICFLLNAKDV